MISLFITCLLSFFCCSSITFNALDNTKEIEKSEVSVKQAIPSVNTDGSIAYAYYFNSDLLSFEFGMNFITYMSQNVSTTWSANNNSQPTYVFTNVPAKFCLVEQSNLFTPYYTCDRIEVYKNFIRSYTVDNVEIFENQYDIVFLYNSWSNHLGTLSYKTIAPVGFSAAIFSSINIYGDLTNRNWSYYEDNNQGFAPITKCCYEHLYEGILFDPETYQSIGYNDGYNKGYNDGKNNGFQTGYNQGLQDGADYDAVALTIFTGVIDIGLMPVNFFLSILNFEVFGINVAGFVSALLTIAIVVIVIRLVTGKKE